MMNPAMEQAPTQEVPVAPQAEQQAAPGTPAAPGDKAAKAYKSLLVAAMKVVYDKERAPALVKMMEANPQEGAAQAALVVLEGLKEQTKNLSPNFVYTASSAVLGMLYEIGQTAGVVQDFKPAMIPESMQIMAKQLQGQQQGQQQPAEAPQAQPTAPAAQGRGLISAEMGV